LFKLLIYFIFAQTKRIYACFVKKINIVQGEIVSFIFRNFVWIYTLLSKELVSHSSYTIDSDLLHQLCGFHSHLALVKLAGSLMCSWPSTLVFVPRST